MPWCSKRRNENGKPDRGLDSSLDSDQCRPETPWRWYAQVAGVATLACGATTTGLYASFFADWNHSLHWPSLAAMTTVIAALAVTVGFVAGKQWTIRWVSLGWLAPFAVVYSWLKATGWLRDSAEFDRAVLLALGLLALLGAVSTLAGMLVRARRHWAYATLAVPLIWLATAAVLHLANSFS